MAVYVSLGMSPLQAIQTATINDADLLGWSDKVGTCSLASGPTSSPSMATRCRTSPRLQHVKFVMKAGEMVKDEYRK